MTSRPGDDVGMPKASRVAAEASKAPDPPGEGEGSNGTGHWRDKEHQLFLFGYETHGKKWDLVAKVVGTRSQSQVRSHAQKHFKKPMRAKPPIEVRCMDPPAPGPWRKFETRRQVVDSLSGEGATGPGLTKQTLATLLGKGLEYEVRKVAPEAGDGTPLEVRRREGSDRAWHRFKSMDDAAKHYSPDDPEAKPEAKFTIHHISALLNSHYEARYADREEAEKPDVSADAEASAPAADAPPVKKRRRKKADAPPAAAAA